MQPTFTDSKYASATQKSQIFKTITTFIEKGMSERLFTTNLYRQLTLSFEHIAHTDNHGFYHVWFSTPQQRLDWIKHLLSMNCYGSPDYTLCDVQEALKTWIQETGQLEKYAEAANVTRNEWIERIRKNPEIYVDFILNSQ